MEKLIDFLETFIYNTIPEFIFGARIQGEPATKQPTFQSTYPQDRPSQFDWSQEFRVSSLHNVNQRVYLEAE
jgi:hypothetical protein